MCLGEIIPLRRLKTVVAGALASRFAVVEKAPSKWRELRAAKPLGRILLRVQGSWPLSGFREVKFVQRARRHAKLRLFRVWKLFDEVKQCEPAAAPDFRPVAERLKAARRMLHL
jgi:hypothetical protein